VALIRLASGSRRSTEKTAAASVDATTLPRMTAVRHSTPSSQCATSATTTTLTATPSVASRTAKGSAGRTTDQRVVSPPSARMTARATSPSSAVRP
jgi:hypothetical protein